MRFDAADVMFFGGGSNYHLMRWINRSGLAKLLPEYLKSKVYVGVSAGSMVTSKDQPVKFSQAIYKDSEGLWDQIDKLASVSKLVADTSIKWIKELPRWNTK